jgi:hypothetical protein
MYAQAWAQFKTWNRLGIAGLLVGVISMIAVAFLDDGGHGRPIAPAIGYTLGGIGIASLLMFIYCYLRQQYFRCPRCAQYFSRNSFWWSGLLLSQRRCIHCRLDLYEGP